MVTGIDSFKEWFKRSYSYSDFRGMNQNEPK